MMQVEIGAQANLFLIAFFPLIGAVLAYLVGIKHRAAAGWIATGAATLSFLWVIRSFLTLNALDLQPDERVLTQNLFHWIQIGGFKADFLLRFDTLTAVMCLVVTGVGSLIHLYSTAYMAEDPAPHRFFAYLNLFMFSMLLLVLGGNLLILFIGWEGVGLCSYLLIGFWHKNLAFAAAGRKAFVVNRIGDAGFLLGIFLLFERYGTINFAELESAMLMQGAAVGFVSLVALCLFVGACGKSAQIPLFVWLPDAMAGPTPVSALIHAATMVTAGVYMLARLNYLFAASALAAAVILIVAVLTALIAALTALTQYDIKKVLAYSTVSQLGFMFMAAAAGAYWVAIFHVVTHAFFKACLFLGAGSVIHGCHHEQDMRQMGGLLRKMPVTAITYLVSVLAISGIFFFSGYQSKHAILASLEHMHNAYLIGALDYILLLVNFTAFLTAFYMMRSFTMTFLGEYRGHAHPHESPWPMTLPLVILALLATFSGILLQSESYSLQAFLSPVLPRGYEQHHESVLAALLHSWIGVLGVGLALVFYTKLKAIPGILYKTFLPIGVLSQNKFFFDEVYAALIVNPLEGAARFLWKHVDQAVIDGSVNGTAALVDVSGEIRRVTQTGQLRFYALCLFLATIFFLLFYLVL
ncbi:MAG: NADH-quinone oxidoreductase subunit L [Bdellovibrionales bacterium]|nr:NADH-quinone oxidoreductase subunit L [Bdellovibrionales bacterium]